MTLNGKIKINKNLLVIIFTSNNNHNSSSKASKSSSLLLFRLLSRGHDFQCPAGIRIPHIIADWLWTDSHPGHLNNLPS